jgi:hypothetical protein
VGYTTGDQVAIFENRLTEMQARWSDDRFREVLRNHGIEDRTKDILFLQLAPTIAVVKVKVLSQVIVYTKTDNKLIGRKASKVLFSDLSIPPGEGG